MQIFLSAFGVKIERVVKALESMKAKGISPTKVRLPMPIIAMVCKDGDAVDFEVTFDISEELNSGSFQIGYDNGGTAGPHLYLVKP